MPVYRTKFWEKRLEEYINIAYTSEVEPGKFDCCLFTGKCVEALTERDFTKVYMGDYKTWTGAKRRLKKDGVLDVEGLMDKFAHENGWARCTISKAHRGDIVSAKPSKEFPREIAVGIIGLDPRYALFVADGGGLTKINREALLNAWHIE